VITRQKTAASKKGEKTASRLRERKSPIQNKVTRRGKKSPKPEKDFEAFSHYGTGKAKKTDQTGERGGRTS